MEVPKKGKEGKPALKQLIADSGLTQRDLAKKTGIPERTINSWVAGERMPSLDKAALLAGGLKCSLREIASSLGIDVSGIPGD